MNSYNEASISNKILAHLIINYPFMPDIGLLHGKMGGVIFFYNYAKHSQKDYYEKIAEYLFDNLTGCLFNHTRIDFEHGLCGIGWGIEYLIQNQFIAGNSDEILEDIDRKIMEKDIRRISDFSFATGLEGILYYIITRLESYDRGNNHLHFDSAYLKDLYESINRPGYGNHLNREMVNQYNSYYNNRKINYDNTPEISEIFYGDLLLINEDNPNENFIGIKNGMTGFLLKQILK